MSEWPRNLETRWKKGKLLFSETYDMDSWWFLSLQDTKHFKQNLFDDRKKDIHQFGTLPKSWYQMHCHTFCPLQTRVCCDEKMGRGSRQPSGAGAVWRFKSTNRRWRAQHLVLVGPCWTFKFFKICQVWKIDPECSTNMFGIPLKPFSSISRFPNWCPWLGKEFRNRNSYCTLLYRFVTRSLHKLAFDRSGC